MIGELISAPRSHTRSALGLNTNGHWRHSEVTGKSYGYRLDGSLKASDGYVSSSVNDQWCSLTGKSSVYQDRQSFSWPSCDECYKRLGLVWCDMGHGDTKTSEGELMAARLGSNPGMGRAGPNHAGKPAASGGETKARAASFGPPKLDY